MFMLTWLPPGGRLWEINKPLLSQPNQMSRRAVFWLSVLLSSELHRQQANTLVEVACLVERSEAAFPGRDAFPRRFIRADDARAAALS